MATARGRLPERVSAALEVLKREYNTYLEVKLIKGRYCLFEATSRYDRGLGRSRKITKYLGRITEEGILIPVRHRQPTQKQIAQAIAREEALTKLEGLHMAPSSEEGMGEYDDRILMNLSMNGRISRNTIADRIGLKRTATEYQIRKAEQRYGIRYLAEADVNKLGYLEFVILIKFRDRQPSPDEIREALKGMPMVQLCAILKGDYDLIIYILTENDLQVTNERFRQIRSSVFVKYSAEWKIKFAHTAYGYIPLRDEFFKMLEEKVWRRTKESPRPKPGSLLYSDYAVLKELSADGSRQLSLIDAKYGFPKGRSQYVYHKLLDNGMLRRVTINMKGVPVRQDAVIVMERVNLDRFNKRQADWRRDTISYGPHPTNTFSLIIDIWDPDGSVRIAPLYSGESVDRLVEHLKQVSEGAEFSSMVITEVLIGELCYRRFDNRYSAHYKYLVEAETHGKGKLELPSYD
ncbi:MAG: Lrp/AsnC family transcriptional regulator [Candidatus Micrarchaeota archaeon]|nr:Lrp/AsnC family transcriptional regulator [Candidatus Micrarchaeota archaeon]